jgi:hypothetical protein
MSKKRMQILDFKIENIGAADGIVRAIEGTILKTGHDIDIIPIKDPIGGQYTTGEEIKVYAVEEFKNTDDKASAY